MAGSGFELPGFELPGFELPGFELLPPLTESALLDDDAAAAPGTTSANAAMVAISLFIDPRFLTKFTAWFGSALPGRAMNKKGREPHPFFPSTSVWN